VQERTWFATPLESCRKLGGRHFPSVEPAAVDDKSPVSDRVNSALFLTCGINIGRNGLQHDDVMLLNQVNDLALDIGVIAESSPNRTLSENRNPIRASRKRTFLHENSKERKTLELARSIWSYVSG
jgi:hypothetical protein